MKQLVIHGGKPLSGELTVQGAKNSSLPLLAATVLVNGTSIINNCPKLSDVDVACQILKYLGCKVHRDQGSIIVDSTNLTCTEIPEDLMAEMRSSIVFLGAVVARMKHAKMNFPGGCELGPRPIDLHLSALRQLGVTVDDSSGVLECTATHLKGNSITLSFPSVGATENAILTACLADGVTTIHNAASEPEIIDLANFLNACGAEIIDAGKQNITIKGVKSLHDGSYTAMPDRIVTATYLCAVVLTGGELLLHNVERSHIQSILSILEQTGATLSVEKDKIYCKASGRHKAIDVIRTMPYPGFPTDAQPLFMALSTTANGTTLFVENIFENRYKQAEELIKMGADISLEGKVAVVRGVPKLVGSKVRATDLRGGAALVIAGLAAENKTIVSDIRHIDRGYESIENCFSSLGGNIIRTDS